MPRKTALVIVLFATLAVLAAWLDPAPPPLSGTGQGGDGDSFRLGDQRIRLLGLDAPERGQRCDRADGTTWACGMAAQARLAALLASGSVRCIPEAIDRYERLLARCTRGDDDIGALLVSEGLAVSSGDYWREEGAARGAGRGLWQGGFQRPADWREDHPRPKGILGWLDL